MTIQGTGIQAIAQLRAQATSEFTETEDILTATIANPNTSQVDRTKAQGMLDQIISQNAARTGDVASETQFITNMDNVETDARMLFAESLFGNAYGDNTSLIEDLTDSHSGYRMTGSSRRDDAGNRVSDSTRSDAQSAYDVVMTSFRTVISDPNVSPEAKAEAAAMMEQVTEMHSKLDNADVSVSNKRGHSPAWNRARLTDEANDLYGRFEDAMKNMSVRLDAIHPDILLAGVDDLAVVPDALGGLDASGPLIEDASYIPTDGETTSGAGALGSGSDPVPGSKGLADMIDDPQAMLRLQNSDPAAFAEAYRNTPDEDKPAVMQLLQSQMQENNQLNQLMSNIMNAEHTTAKAVISNIRV